jgi:ubiquinone/menaquinone biosynthesis C-methylase UbiE
VSDNHLDVGPGTGYFLDKCRFESPNPRIALLDLNPNCLESASNRIARYKPELYQGSALDKVAIDGPSFDSIGLNYVLHCLPGTIRTKSAVFGHLESLLNPGGTLFGGTALYNEVPHTWMSRRMMDAYNKDRLFSNTEDDLTGLTWGLSQYLSNVVTEVVGCVAFFSAQKR